MFTKRIFLSLGLLFAGLVSALGITPPLHAQSDPCTTVIAELKQTILDCTKINTNWACYGHRLVEAEPTTIRFQKPRNSLPLADFASITTRYRDGAALLKLHLTGDNAPMTAMLFGGAELSPQGNNFFLLRSAGTQLLCADTPPSLVIRTASGEHGQLTVNGVQITLGSTVVLALYSPQQLAIANVEGNVQVSVPRLGEVAGVTQTLAPGEGVQVTQDNGVPIAVSPPGPAAIATSAVMQWLASAETGLQAVSEPSCGSAIAYGQTLSGQTFTPSEECLYTFQGTAGEVVTIALEATDSTLDPWIDLRGPDYHLIKYNNDAALNNMDSLICNRGLSTTGLYTIVARPHDNNSTGPFQITLNRATGCTPPPAQCTIVAPRLLLRSQPTMTAPEPVIALRQGARLQPIRHSTDGQWLEVTSVATGKRGWVNLDGASLLCTDEEVIPTPPAASTGTVCIPNRPPGWVDYLIKPGDTLSQIAQRTGATVRQLIMVNCLSNTMIRVGQHLFVPAPPCPAMTLTEFTLEPNLYANTDTAGVAIEWAASGGCDPVTGTLMARYVGADGRLLRSADIGVESIEERYSLVNRSGRLELAVPYLTGCRLTAEFALTLTDKSGRSTTTQKSATFYDYCERVTPIPTDTPTVTPTVTVTDTPITPVPECTPLALSSLSLYPAGTATFVAWNATGGCDPVAGTITVVYSDSAVGQEEYAVSGLGGSLSLPFPASTACLLSGTFTLQLTDSSGQSASTSSSATLRDDCAVVNTPVETPTPPLVVTTAPTTTVIINGASVVTETSSGVGDPTTPTPPLTVVTTVTPADTMASTPVVEVTDTPPPVLPVTPAEMPTLIAPVATAALLPLPTETPTPPLATQP